MRPVKRLDALIPAVLRQTARRYVPLRNIQRSWGRLVGKQLAAHTKPVSLRRGRLIVHVAGPGDGFTLNYQRVKLLERLQTTSKSHVEDIVIRAGEV